jgi:hypothetical protein
MIPNVALWMANSKHAVWEPGQIIFSMVVQLKKLAQMANVSAHKARLRATVIAAVLSHAKRMVHGIQQLRHVPMDAVQKLENAMNVRVMPHNALTTVTSRFVKTINGKRSPIAAAKTNAMPVKVHWDANVKKLHNMSAISN